MTMNRLPSRYITRHRYRWAAAVAVAAVLALVTSARADATTAADETPASQDPAVAMYAADYSVSPEEAARRLDRIQPLHELMASVREAEAERVAGWGIDHSPTFTGWVLLSGTEAPTAVSATTAEANADLTKTSSVGKPLLPAQQGSRQRGTRYGGWLW